MGREKRRERKEGRKGWKIISFYIVYSFYTSVRTFNFVLILTFHLLSFFELTVAGAFSSVQIAVGESMAEILENISLNWATVLERLSETRGEA